MIVKQLEKELDSTKVYLQSIIEDQERTNEELKSANEEVQSANEELQSTNEELETAKEELQSTNEELNTLNEELQNRNIQLSEVNNDMINLLASVNIPIIILKNDLEIRRTTPAAEKVLNVIPADIGRSINDIKLKIDVPGIEHIIREVIDTLHAKEETHSQLNFPQLSRIFSASSLSASITYEIPLISAASRVRAAMSPRLMYSSENFLLPVIS